ncbi:38531_t:CDS:2, partial [Gigaspora margarita]
MVNGKIPSSNDTQHTQNNQEMTIPEATTKHKEITISCAPKAIAKQRYMAHPNQPRNNDTQSNDKKQLYTAAAKHQKTMIYGAPKATKNPRNDE